MKKNVGNIEIENATIVFRNFSGKPGQYNAEGCRNFCVLLDKELATALQKDGWNIRSLTPKEDGDETQEYIQVTVAYDPYPPNIFLITRGKTKLDEESISLLDWAEIENVDIVIRPYEWTRFKGTPKEISGIKAYVKNMYVTITEDRFEKKYYDVPDSAQTLITEEPEPYGD